MAWFGKSEEEIKKLQEQLDNREKELNDRRRNMDQIHADVVNREKHLNSLQSELIEKDAELGKRERGMIHRELEAKNEFVKQQREAFHEAIDSQTKQLDSRNRELNSLEQTIDERLRTVIEKEGKLAVRERILKERELSADVGFASKNQVSLRELEKREDACKAIEEQLKDRETANFSKLQALEKQAEKLRQREENLREAEIVMQEGFAEQKKILADELSVRRASFDKEINELRNKRYNDLGSQIEDERSQRLAALEKEIAEKRSCLDEDLKTLSEQFEEYKNTEVKRIKENDEQIKEEKRQLSELKKKLEENSGDLEIETQLLEARRNKLIERERDIDGEVEHKISERKKSYENEEVRLRIECERLRESIKSSGETYDIFNELKRRFGGEEPEKVLLRLNTQAEELKTLRSELLERPTKEMRIAFDEANAEKQRLEDACNRLTEENETIRNNARKQSQLEMQILELKDHNSSLTSHFESVHADNNRLTEELNRHRVSYESSQEREKRIKYIETPLWEVKNRDRAKSNVNEIEWLNGIMVNCAESEFYFPKRIVYAYHTALKTAEWSPLTVLAGVSGTGKSKLPELYAHFGGFNFLNVSVQPNWDSQEAMLGFFNSIDNYFDSQPILRFLAQSQKEATNEYKMGLADVMNIILLDEMNLAHIELYFAEFLSKLEQRRGQKNVPWLDVKLGAKMEPYRIPMGRNILWSGTMNNDETTKSLSDKVLDRGIIINFPRPDKLRSMKKLSSLKDPAPLITKKIWGSWLSQNSNFAKKQIEPFKTFIENMNNSLANAGRALGHRVWQSIEYYMANYPTIKALEVCEKKEFLEFGDKKVLNKEMKIAFEDQLVQKVMPKLRGIETRGQARTKCLDKIRTQLKEENYAIVDDFDFACEFGHGQFMWHSASYLKDDGPDSVKNNDSVEQESHGEPERI